MLSGVVMLFFGITGLFHSISVTKRYAVTEGVLFDYQLQSESEYDAVRHRSSSATYRLVYRYSVEGRAYTVTTDAGTSFLPEPGSTKQIRYDPRDPAHAFVVAPDQNTVLIFGGLFFLLIPLVILLAMLGVLQNLSSRLVGASIALLLILASYGALYMISGSASIAGIFAYYVTSFSLPLLIPLLMIAAGLFLFLKSLFFETGQHTK